MTMNYYQNHAQTFFDGTVDLDMSPLYADFMVHLPEQACVLDAGCGSGRDALAFARKGYNVEAFDASAELVALARHYSGLPVKEMTFDQLNETQKYDGIWCCASLLHVPYNELPAVINTLARALKPGGIWYLSFKYGDSERELAGRRFSDMTETRLTALLAPLPELIIHKMWITQDQRPDHDESWLNALVNKR
ncbi:class I SAM-dependent methyltransferase [Kosakonia cowanii]|uniref:class I SAM-dependent methyltransferase n=1 Tax=Kosakonia cowanii TaxID=208223 RepID=UPI0023F8EE90|nr:class I SAM-dependent methyltransferase [Kosakonia cowanii]MDF7761459.1 class I SAM-dependent methyltransferase [Kosakonia cowanii]